MKDHTKAIMKRQIEVMAQALSNLAHEVQSLKEATQTIAKVAHYHGEPEVKEKLATDNPEWTKSTYQESHEPPQEKPEPDSE